jgi:signal transduction histidine kinase
MIRVGAMRLRSLSSRLLILTAFFVMLGEVLIFVPSVARFRVSWFEDRIAAGRLAALALEASPSGEIDAELTRRVLDHVGAEGIVLERPGGMVLMLAQPVPPSIDLTIDLRKVSMLGAIRGSFATLARRDDRVLRVRGPAPIDPAETVELLLEEAPLRRAMWGFGFRVLELSIGLSLLTAALVYLSLQWLLVRPMRRVTASMTRFRDDPEDASRMIAPSARTDEIGLAERELAVLQETVRQALGQRARLAALGTAVTKISHDLRNILSTARLVADGLTASAAPEVRRLAPRLVNAIDRAVALSKATLDYSREGAPPMAPSRFALAPLIAEIGPGLGEAGAGLVVDCTLPPALMVKADRDQLYRIFSNLARNAVEAGAQRLRVSAGYLAGALAIEVGDDGPGLPPKARDNLFRPFFGTARPGGSGLGLAIARELARAHGGELALLSSTAAGTVFRLTLPAPAATAVAAFSRAPASPS